MVGVQLQYLFDQVIRFSHEDFLTALRVDLGPVLGDLGLWSIKTLQDQAKERGDTDMKKKL